MVERVLSATQEQSLISAPDSISLCPRCSSPIRSSNWVSFNSFDAVRWTDGAVTAMPEFPVIVVCPHCHIPVLASELKPRWCVLREAVGIPEFLRRPNPEGTEDGIKTGMDEHPTQSIAPKDVEAAGLWVKEFSVAEIDDGLRMVAGDFNLTLAIRRLVWHRSNDSKRRDLPEPHFGNPPSLWRVGIVKHGGSMGELDIRLMMAGITRKRRSAGKRALLQIIQECGDISLSSADLKRLVSLTKDAVVYEDILFNVYLELSKEHRHPAEQHFLPAEVENLNALAALLTEEDESARLEKVEALRELGRWLEAEQLLEFEFQPPSRRAANQLRCLVRRRLSTVEVWW